MKKTKPQKNESITRSLGRITDELIDALKPDSKRFLELCEELKTLHVLKAADYGNGRDPLGNFAQARDWGIDPFMGVMIRIGDKIARLQSFALKGVLQNEPVIDTLKDNAAYSLLAIVILEREQREHGPR